MGHSQGDGNGQWAWALRGHLVIMLSPERVTGPTVGWRQMMFRNDEASRAMFVGANCGLCGQSSDFDCSATRFPSNARSALENASRNGAGTTRSLSFHPR
jgi:hypothetical protein